MNDLHYLKAIRIRLEQLYEEHPNDPALREHISDEVDWIDAKLSSKEPDTKALVDLVQTLIDNDPVEPIADNGMTVLDGWRDRARRALGTSPLSAAYGFATR